MALIGSLYIKNHHSLSRKGLWWVYSIFTGFTRDETKWNLSTVLDWNQAINHKSIGGIGEWKYVANGNSNVMRADANTLYIDIQNAGVSTDAGGRFGNVGDKGGKAGDIYIAQSYVYNYYSPASPPAMPQPYLDPAYSSLSHTARNSTLSRTAWGDHGGRKQAIMLDIHPDITTSHTIYWYIYLNNTIPIGAMYKIGAVAQNLTIMFYKHPDLSPNTADDYINMFPHLLVAPFTGSNNPIRMIVYKRELHIYD